VSVEGDRGPSCVLRHSVSVIQIHAQIGCFLFIHEIRIGGVGPADDCQQSVDYNIGVSSNR
jgi:hypothetical protein